MMNFEVYLEHCIDHLPECTVTEAMRYSLTAGGKRLRPQMMLSVAGGYGISEETVLPLAAALEMIHTYSLIHDDLPAMDNDDLRRGKPTCHKQYGEAAAILAGDGLLTEAFQVAATADLSSEQIVEAIRILSANAGGAGMIYGQDIDTIDLDMTADWEGLKKVHYYKTGCLFSSALMLGALAAGKDSAEIIFWEELGKEIGLAFQIQDDILDVTSTPELLGKSNSDIRNGKITAVSLLGLDEAQTLMNSLYEDAVKKIENLGEFDSKGLMNIFEGVIHRSM